MEIFPGNRIPDLLMRMLSTRIRVRQKHPWTFWYFKFTSVYRKNCIYNKVPILFCIQDLGCIADYFLKSRSVSETEKVQASHHQWVIIKTAQEVMNKNKVSHTCFFCLFWPLKSRKNKTLSITYFSNCKIFAYTLTILQSGLPYFIATPSVSSCSCSSQIFSKTGWNCSGRLLICSLYSYVTYFHVFEFAQGGTNVVYMFWAWRS